MSGGSRYQEYIEEHEAQARADGFAPEVAFERALSGIGAMYKQYWSKAYIEVRIVAGVTWYRPRPTWPHYEAYCAYMVAKKLERM